MLKHIFLFYKNCNIVDMFRFFFFSKKKVGVCRFVSGLAILMIDDDTKW